MDDLLALRVIFIASACPDDDDDEYTAFRSKAASELEMDAQPSTLVGGSAAPNNHRI